MILNVISLGAGVQSSTMALMAASGELTPMPTAAIFADTQAEPASVYRWLEWLTPRLPFPVLRVTHGDLAKVSTTIRTKKDGSGQWVESGIPAFVSNPDGTAGIMPRQCTYQYKVVPLTRAAVRLMKREGAGSVSQWIGISLDEAHRMKPARDKRITNRWPLVELRMRRHDCLRWMQEHGYPRPPRSACVFCPFHSDAEWRRLRDEEPAEWQRAVAFDEEYRRVKHACRNTAGLPYLHNSLRPLADVDLTTDIERGQLELFGNDCEGMCGV